MDTPQEIKGGFSQTCSQKTFTKHLENCAGLLSFINSQQYHFHVRIKNKTKRNSATKILGEAFPEFDGAQNNVTPLRSWSSVRQYILKYSNPLVWGEDSLQSSKIMKLDFSTRQTGVTGLTLKWV